MLKRLIEWMINVFEPAPIQPTFPIEKPKPRPQVKKATTRKTIMPLKKSTSKEAFKSNVKAELAAGKKPAQAVAIAYSEKREAAKTTKPKRK